MQLGNVTSNIPYTTKLQRGKTAVFHDFSLNRKYFCKLFKFLSICIPHGYGVIHYDTISQTEETEGIKCSPYIVFSIYLKATPTQKAIVA